jgi:hypothetical protein
MIDASFSRQRHQEDRAVVRVRRLRTVAIALAIILIGLGGALFWGFGSSTVAALPSSASTVAAPAREPVSDEFLKTARGLGITQQQAVDQLQVVQDQAAAQKAETQKLSEQIVAVTEKLDAPPAVNCQYPGTARCAASFGAEVAPPIRAWQAPRYGYVG